MSDLKMEGAVSVITGHCHCGHIKYEVPGPIVKCSTCDCEGCRRATGALAAPFVTVKREGFVFTGGEPAEFDAGSGEKCDRFGVWRFCPKCGGPVLWQGHDGEEYDLFAGTLNNPSLFRLPK